jgi:RND family efflux transporter MFP subunit
LTRRPGVAAGALAALAIALAGTSTADDAQALARVRLLVVADEETTLSSGMAGRVVELPKRPGDAVKSGEPLVRFDCSEGKARVDVGKAELQGARLQHEAKLRLQGLQSASELDVALAAAVVEKAKAQLALVQAEAAHCTVAAPFAGRVAKWQVKPHQTVSAGQPLIDLVGDGTLRARLNVPSGWLAWLRLGQPFEATVEETGKAYPLKLDRVSPRVDAVSQTVEVEAVFDAGAAGLLPGMSGSARFTRSP